MTILGVANTTVALAEWAALNDYILIWVVTQFGYLQMPHMQKSRFQESRHADTVYLGFATKRLKSTSVHNLFCSYYVSPCQMTDTLLKLSGNATHIMSSISNCTICFKVRQRWVGVSFFQQTRSLVPQSDRVTCNTVRQDHLCHSQIGTGASQMGQLVPQ